ncbi:MAG: T9SS type A sorting domain-containing protein [Dysgonamonadaceae bacterium]|jgi:hypothetical protein|nr:T9SS type A sorting domain-containing protein [Dysgonamonadaceae bacterium]
MKKYLLILFLSVNAFGAYAQVVEYTLHLRSDDCQRNVYINIGEPTALDEINPSLYVYPNPATDILNVPTLAAGKDACVRLLDIDGKLLQQKTVSGNESLCQFVLTNYPAGIYFVQVVGRKKTVYKIVKN